MTMSFPAPDPPDGVPALPVAFAPAEVEVDVCWEWDEVVVVDGASPSSPVVSGVTVEFLLEEEPAEQLFRFLVVLLRFCNGAGAEEEEERERES